jgi:uncharacterized membrane protein YgcG
MPTPEYRSPEEGGKPIIEDQERGEALNSNIIQSIVGGGGAIEGENKEEAQFDMTEDTATEAEQAAYEEFYAKEKKNQQNMAPVVMKYRADNAQQPKAIPTFNKDCKANVMDWTRDISRALQAVPTRDKKVLDMSFYLSTEGGAKHAIQQALAEFSKHYRVPGQTALTEEHFAQYVKLKYILQNPSVTVDHEELKDNVVWTYARDLFDYSDKFVATVVEVSAKGNAALELNLQEIKDKGAGSVPEDARHALVLDVRGLASTMVQAFYDNDTLNVSQEREWSLRNKVNAFRIKYDGGDFATQLAWFDQLLMEHRQVLDRLRLGGEGPEAGKHIDEADRLYIMNMAFFHSDNASRNSAAFNDIASEVSQIEVAAKLKYNARGKLRTAEDKTRALKQKLIALQQIKNAKKKIHQDRANFTQDRKNNGGGSGGGSGGGGGGSGGRGTGREMRCRDWLDTGKCPKGDECTFSHSFDHSKVPMCNSKTTSACKFRRKCNFRHTAESTVNVAKNERKQSRVAAEAEESGDSESEDDE